VDARHGKLVVSVGPKKGDQSGKKQTLRLITYLNNLNCLFKEAEMKNNVDSKARFR
jgi:hypothetical protein